MAKPDTIDGILFEIARTLDFCRTDFPGSARYKSGATAHLRARREGRWFAPEIQWKGGEMEVRGGDWYEIPTLLLDLSRLVEAGQGPVKSFTGQFSPQDVLTLQAKGAHGLLGEWSLAFSKESTGNAQHSPELLAQADDVSGIPEGIVGALQDLNDWLRNRLFPLKPKVEVPVKFWNAPEPVVMWSALQYLYGYLLKPYDYDATALPALPEGYTTACTIFEMFEQIENEGLETAIENLGADYRDALVAELRRVGATELGDLFRAAWNTHPGSTKADAKAFALTEARIDQAIEDEATLDVICAYFSRRADLFEQQTGAR